METIFWTIAAIAVIGLVVYYLISQKKISIPGISKKEGEPKTPPTSPEEYPEEEIE